MGAMENGEDIIVALETALEILISVDLVMVGFGENGSEIAGDVVYLVQKHLNGLPLSARKAYAQREGCKKSEPAAFIPLNVSQRVKYRVGRASLSMQHRLNNALKTADWNEEEGLFRVSPSAIDEIIMSYASQEKESSYILYLLQLDPPGSHHYFDPSDTCGTVGWIGVTERYAWIDTSAVSIGWGPRHKGRGGIRPGKLLEFGKEWRNDIVPQLAALTYRATTQLFAHPLHLWPEADIGQFRRPIEVEIYNICDELPCPGPLSLTWATLGEDMLQSQLSDIALFAPKPKVVIRNIVLSNVPHVRKALYSAMDRESSSDVILVKDTDALLSELKQIVVAENKSLEPGAHREVLVFNIGLKQEVKPVLLDGRGPALAIGESVISICTAHCLQEEQHRQETKNVGSNLCGSRIIDEATLDQVNKIGYAYLLQALWGIRPRQLTWDPLWARADVDDLWSTMLGALHSPFSPSKLELGFPERDAYPKSLLVLQLHDCFKRQVATFIGLHDFKMAAEYMRIVNSTLEILENTGGGDGTHTLQMDPLTAEPYNSRKPPGSINHVSSVLSFLGFFCLVLAIVKFWKISVRILNQRFKIKKN